MRLTKVEITEACHEIEVEYSFLFIKWRKVYRKINSKIWIFKEPDKYSHLGISEYLDVSPLFLIPSCYVKENS